MNDSKLELTLFSVNAEDVRATVSDPLGDWIEGDITDKDISDIMEELVDNVDDNIWDALFEEYRNAICKVLRPRIKEAEDE